MYARDRLVNQAFRRDELLASRPMGTSYTRRARVPDGFVIVRAETRIVGLSIASVRDVRTGAEHTCRSAIDAQRAADRAVEALRQATYDA